MSMPELSAMINEREDAIRGSLTDDGNRVGFAMIWNGWVREILQPTV